MQTANRNQQNQLGTPAPLLIFNAERHLFLIAAWKLIEHMDWSTKVGLPYTEHFSELYSMREDIKSMRDMNEHAIGYFLGKGRRQDEFVTVSEFSGADASSTIGTKIGNRLDWNVVVAAVEKLLKNLPATFPWDVLNGDESS
ncbi:hypothetical protein MXD81_35960 [Microbacteriaceae bacterium K1510]|nr:hypothetical protein [Microbacteriaceae bacterium K1510]